MVVLTVFTLWITPESSDSNKSCVLYMTMSTFAAGLALWEGYKNGIYSALFKANSCFWKFLWEHSKPDSNFQVNKKQFSAFLDHFMSFQ